jgi:hypothetical protein
MFIFFCFNHQSLQVSDSRREIDDWTGNNPLYRPKASPGFPGGAGPMVWRVKCSSVRRFLPAPFGDPIREDEAGRH